MKRSYEIVLVLFFAVVLSSFWANAQIKGSKLSRSDRDVIERNRDETRLNQRIEMLTKRLALTSDQIEKVETIDRQNMNNLQLLRERNSFGNNRKSISSNFGGKDITPSAEQRAYNNEFKMLRNSSDDKIAELLVKKQKLKFAKLRESEMEKLDDRMNGLKLGTKQNRNSGKSRQTVIPGIKNNKQNSFGK